MIFKKVRLYVLMVTILHSSWAIAQNTTASTPSTSFAPKLYIKSPNANYFDYMHDLGLIQKSFLADSGQYVGCGITILHSMESTPSQYLDSLKGQYYASGRAKYVRLSNAETIQNDSITLTVYSEDKVILAMPRPADSRSRVAQSDLMITSIDSAFVAGNADSVKITSSGNQKIMTFYFINSSRYQSAVLVYDASSYIPGSMSYILKQTKFHEEGKPVPDGNIITIQINNYSTSAFDQSILNVNKYIQTDVTGKATLQLAYQTYQLVQQGKLTNRSTTN